MAVLVALALLFLGAVSSIIKALTVRPSSDDVPESDYYKLDIDEGEKRARGERRE